MCPTEPTAVPAGQVACLLCRGFISVAEGDRARFVDHMHSEHEVKHEPEVILAVSVLTPREKLFLIKTAAARLEAIGRGRAPDLNTSFLDRLEATATRPTIAPPAPQRGGGAFSLGRGAAFTPARLPSSQPRPRIVSSPQQRMPPPRVIAPPRQLAANSSISISKVDMSRPCNMCHVMMPSPAALIEHMNKNHFRGLAGLNIVQQGAPSRPSLPTPPSPVSPREAPPPSRGPILTPAQAKALSLSKNPNGGLGSPRLPITRSPGIQQRMQSPSPTQPPNKMARSETIQGVSFSRPINTSNKAVNSSSEELLDEGSKEKSIRKEVEGLQTLELLDNLVNFLNDT